MFNYKLQHITYFYVKWVSNDFFFVISVGIINIF